MQNDFQIDIPEVGRQNVDLTGLTIIPTRPPITIPTPSPVTKTVYLYEPPEEIEEPSSNMQIISLTRPKINYKIIFIKAPAAAPTLTAPFIPPLTQDQQKALIYVLIKRPEEAPEITIPTVAATAPSKPEVYFIR